MASCTRPSPSVWPARACAGLLALTGCRSLTEPAAWGDWTRPDVAGEGLPNVLLVSLDTVSAQHLELHGYRRQTMPTLTRLAGEGARFTQSWSQSPQTDGTHAALFTGRLSSYTGRYHFDHTLHSREWTLAEHFRNEGYRTWAITSSKKFEAATGLDQGFEEWEVQASGPVIPRGDRAVEVALNQMSAQPGIPWFGFVHLYDAHAPYTAPEPFRSTFHPEQPSIPPRETVNYLAEHRHDDEIPKDHLQTLSDLYDAGLAHLDSRLGILAEAASAEGRDTIVVLISDHGEAFFEHGYLGHSLYLWEEIMRVPWVVWSPGRIRPATRIDVPSQSIDLMPTLIELAGLPASDRTQGFSFAPSLQGEPQELEPDRPVILQGVKRWGVVQRTETGLFKYVLRVNEGKRDRMADGENVKRNGSRLFELDSDPEEKTDLKRSNPDMVDALFGVLAALGSADPFAETTERSDITDQDEEALRAMGYVE